MKSLYIIDFSNFAYKFRSAYKFASVEVNNVQVDTSVIFGFTKAIRENPFTDICIVLDGIPSHSKALMPSYKGQRMKDDEKMKLGVPKKELIKYLTRVGELYNKNVFVVCSPLQETDEVIASIVYELTGNLPKRSNFISKLNTHNIEEDYLLRYLLDRDLELSKYDFSQYDHCIIASTDGDFIQCQRFPEVSIDTSTSGKAIVSDRVSDSTEATGPAASVIYKAVYGDTGDNVPSLGLQLKKPNVIKVLNSRIKTSEDLRLFYNGCYMGDHTDRMLRVICREIHSKHLKEFMKNYEVVFLTFRSFPKVIQYKNYNIEDTISKYSLRVR